jgi:fatty-acid desaturase
MDWMLHPNPKYDDREELHKWVADLLKHKFYRRLEKFFWLPSALLGVVCLLIGGLPAVLVVFLVIVVEWHSTWFVNSATHLWGYRRFETKDNSRNLWWVALITYGEGWHNNHHHDQTNPRHGLAWYELDPEWYILRILRSVRLVWGTKD